MGCLYTRLEAGRIDEMELNGDMKCLYTRLKAGKIDEMGRLERWRGILWCVQTCYTTQISDDARRWVVIVCLEMCYATQISEMP